MSQGWIRWWSRTLQLRKQSNLSRIPSNASFMEPIKNVCLQYLLGGKPACVQLDCLLSRCCLNITMMLYCLIVASPMLSGTLGWNPIIWPQTRKWQPEFTPKLAVSPRCLCWVGLGLVWFNMAILPLSNYPICKKVDFESHFPFIKSWHSEIVGRVGHQPKTSAFDQFGMRLNNQLYYKQDLKHYSYSWKWNQK